MKKLLTSLILLTGAANPALAHTLAGDEGLITRLDHQVFGVHHLPLTILLLVIGVMIFTRLRKTL